MSSVLLGLTLLAVAWLVIWTGKDHSRPSQTWWPFAMRNMAPKKAPETGPERARQARGTRVGAPINQRPWRRPGS